MKNLLARVLTPLFLLVLLSAGIASAQYVPVIMVVDIPFEFTVGNKTFAAGEYKIVRVAPDHLDIRDLRGQVLTSVLTHTVVSLQGSPSSRLAFSTENGGHELRQVWIAGDMAGNELSRTKAPVALARQKSQSPVIAAGGNK